MWLKVKGKDGLYVYQVEISSCFVSYVEGKDRAHAALFAFSDVENWIQILERMTGKKFAWERPDH